MHKTFNLLKNTTIYTTKFTHRTTFFVFVLQNLTMLERFDQWNRFFSFLRSVSFHWHSFWLHQIPYDFNEIRYPNTGKQSLYLYFIDIYGHHQKHLLKESTNDSTNNHIFNRLHFRKKEPIIGHNISHLFVKWCLKTVNKKKYRK